MSLPSRIRVNVGKYQCPADPPCLHQDGTPVRFTGTHCCKKLGKTIDTVNGINMDLLNLTQTESKQTCPLCLGLFVNLANHKKCKSGAKAEKKPGERDSDDWKWVKKRENNDRERDYSGVLHWDGEFSVNGKVVEGGYRGLADYFLTQKDCFVVCSTDAWFRALRNELVSNGLKVELGEGNDGGKIAIFQVLVLGCFSIHRLDKFSVKNVKELCALNTLIYGLIQINLLSHWTLAAVAYKYWRQNCPEDVQMLQGADFTLAKRAHYGQRSAYQTGSWRSSMAEEIENGDWEYDELLNKPDSDLYVQVDCNSFYPSTMTSQALLDTYYPVGACRYSKDSQAEYERGTVGLYEVDFQCPEGLKRAILAVRGEKGGLSWPLDCGSGVYCEVDLRHAEDFGYTFEFKGSCLVWDAVGHPFDKYVSEMFALKEAEKDPVRRGQLKFILNSLSGKLGQKENGCANNKKWIEISVDEAFQRDDDGLKWRRVGNRFEKPEKEEDGVSTQKEYQNTKPNFLGAWMMAWTRVQFQQMYDLLDEGCVVYENTDSVRIPLSQYPKLLEKGWISPTALGQFKIEYGLIYEYEQGAGGNYVLKVIKPDGSLDVKESGTYAKCETLPCE